LTPHELSSAGLAKLRARFSSVAPWAAANMFVRTRFALARASLHILMANALAQLSRLPQGREASRQCPNRAP